MSEWRFTITDRNGASAVFQDEFPGWDKNVTEISRNVTMHGVFFNHQGQNLEFHGLAGRMLKNEYDTHGFQGVMYINIEEKCDGEWILSDSGKFVFPSYKYYCSDECYVTIMVEELGEVQDMMNRFNQKVNLESLKSFDETTVLPSYDKLPFDLLLPSKGVLLQNLGENDEVKTTVLQGVPIHNGPGSLNNGNSEQSMIEFGLNKMVAHEIGGFYLRDAPFNYCLFDFGAQYGGPGCNNSPYFDMFPSQSPDPERYIAPLMLSPVENYSEGTANYGIVSDVVDLDVNLHCDITPLNVTTIVTRAILCVLPAGASGDVVTDYRFLVNDLNSTEIVYHDPAFILNPGDRIYCFIWMYHYKTQDQVLTALPAMNLVNRVGDYFRMKTLTHTAATTAKMFAIYETWGRITESITNNKLRVYSEFYGRTDGQPYTTAADGCGSLTAVTNGMRVRKAENRIPGKPNVYSLSLQDCFDGLNPIHNIGMGVEQDTRRPGYNCLRIEEWFHFYNNDVIMECLDVAKIVRSTYQKNVYSTTKFGYDQWESEQYNGLDEFLTQIFSRTTLSEVKNDLVQLSKFIGSGYALEITRRLGNLTSQDWRFDNNSFVVCLQRGKYTIYIPPGLGGFATIIPGIPGLTGADSITIAGTGAAGIDGTYGLTFPIYASGQTTTSIVPNAPVTGTFYGTIAVNGIPQTNDSLSVELGNISGAQNIIDPDTIYNFRIRPVFNAMRWLNRVLMSYRQFNDDAKLIFMDGQANYHAVGEMISTFCKMENQAISEDVTINKELFADTLDAQPIMQPERVEYDYPMSSRDYLAIKANRYGLIRFTGGADCEDGYGWIDNIKYDRTDGMGHFVLIPKIII